MLRTDAERKVVRLRHVEGRSQRAILDATGFSRNRVRRILDDFEHDLRVMGVVRQKLNRGDFPLMVQLMLRRAECERALQRVA